MLDMREGREHTHFVGTLLISTTAYQQLYINNCMHLLQAINQNTVPERVASGTSIAQQRQWTSEDSTLNNCIS